MNLPAYAYSDVEAFIVTIRCLEVIAPEKVNDLIDAQKENEPATKNRKVHDLLRVHTADIPFTRNQRCTNLDDLAKRELDCFLLVPPILWMMKEHVRFNFGKKRASRIALSY